MQTTELEKIERAKTYMDKLANGMNPLDDSMVPEAELINNVHLSRYFFFIPDALRQVIAKGGTLAPVNAKKIKKVPLEILFEKREQFVYSNCPVSGSEVARRINKLEIRRICKSLPIPIPQSQKTGSAVRFIYFETLNSEMKPSKRL